MRRSSLAKATTGFRSALRKSIGSISMDNGLGQHDRPSLITPPTVADVLRYRYHHGVNLGSIFVLEKWLTPSMFPPETKLGQTAELEAAKLWIQKLGLAGARDKFEEHWSKALTDEDLDWLVNTAHATSIRLPIGFFTLGPEFCKGTDFQDVAGLYENAWMYVQRIVARARGAGIGVLLDMHALPGGANDGEHSGTNNGKAQLWGDRTYLHKANFTMQCLLDEAKKMDGVMGIQVVNEAEADAKGMYEWYDTMLIDLYAIDPSMPVYISDAWNLETAVAYLSVHGVGSYKARINPVVIDTHMYWAFTETDKHRPPQRIIEEVPTKLGEIEGHDGNVCGAGAICLVVGEYSNVLTEECHALADDGVPRQESIRRFGEAQCNKYQSRTSGSFFWTYKMDWMPGGEWGFKEQTDSGVIQPPKYMTWNLAEVQYRVEKATNGRSDAFTNAFDSHCTRWENAEPDRAFEHWRYQKGYDTGFDDAQAFFSMRLSGRLGTCAVGGDRIGLLDLWIKKRLIESGMRGEYVWEFEHGFRKGVEDFGKLSGAY